LKWSKDTFTERTMDRPGWNRLIANIEAGKVSKVVCWRLDRCGRTAKGLVTLFDDSPPEVRGGNDPAPGRSDARLEPLLQRDSSG
jgi:hypothetical protein